MNLFAITGIALGTTGTAMGIFMLAKAKGLMHRLWAAFCISTAIWGWGGYMIATTNNIEVADLWWRITHIGVIFIPILFLHFVYQFLNIGRKWFLVVSYILGIFFLIANFIDGLFIANMRWVFDQFYYDSPPGPLYIPFTIFFFALVIYSHYELLKAYRRARGRTRYQIKLFFIAMVISFSGGSLSFLPVYNIDFYPTMNLFASFYPIMIAYAIVRYRLFDVRIIVRRSTIYLIIAGFAYSSLYGVLWLLNRFFGGVYTKNALIIGIPLAIIFSYLFLQFEKIVKRLANKYFFGELYSHQEALRQFSDKITTIVDLSHLLDSLIKNLCRTMNVDKAGVILSHGDKFILEKGKGFPLKLSCSKNSLAELLLNRSQAVVYEELSFEIRDTKSSLKRKELKAAQKDMAKLGAALALPLIVKKRLRGMIILGDKISRDAYTKEDIDLLEILAKQASLAIENARFYSEMEEQVQERTQEIREANERLENLLKAKSEFLDIASHQLRTPVSIIRGMLSMVAEGSISREKEREFIKDAYSTANRLNIIINDLLDATELEGNIIKVNLKPSDLKKVIQGSIKMFEPKAKEKKLYLKFYHPKKKLDLVLVDRAKIQEAVNDLIDNSIKYTKEGGITISLGQDKKEAIIKVSDTGIGLNKEEKNKLFEKFARGQRAVNMIPDGSGLGLFIVKRLIEAHNGTISAESPGACQGTTFTITIPVSP